MNVKKSIAMVKLVCLLSFIIYNQTWDEQKYQYQKRCAFGGNQKEDEWSLRTGRCCQPQIVCYYQRKSIATGIAGQSHSCHCHFPQSQQIILEQSASQSQTSKNRKMGCNKEHHKTDVAYRNVDQRYDFPSDCGSKTSSQKWSNDHFRPLSLQRQFLLHWVVPDSKSKVANK